MIKKFVLFISLSFLVAGCSINTNATKNSGYAGRYELVLNGQSIADQYITLSPSEPGDITHFNIKGHAQWGESSSENVHVGDIEGQISINDNRATYTQPEDGCVITLKFTDGSLTAEELWEPDQKISYCGGANVSFNGTYKKIN